MAFNFSPSGIFTNAIAIQDALALFFNSNEDNVGVWNSETFEQVWTDARPVKAEVKETSRIMAHPVETGAMLADHHIINPIEITLTLLVNSQYYNAAYQEMQAAFWSGLLLSVQTNSSVYDNMIIVNMPHQETPDMFDTLMLSLQLREVLFIDPTIQQPAAASYSTQIADKKDIQNFGLLYPKTTSVLSFAKDWLL